MEEEGSSLRLVIRTDVFPPDIWSEIGSFLVCATDKHDRFDFYGFAKISHNALVAVATAPYYWETRDVYYNKYLDQRLAPLRGIYWSFPNKYPLCLANVLRTRLQMGYNIDLLGVLARGEISRKALRNFLAYVIGGSFNDVPEDASHMKHGEVLGLCFEHYGDPNIDDLQMLAGVGVYPKLLRKSSCYSLNSAFVFKLTELWSSSLTHLDFCDAREVASDALFEAISRCHGNIVFLRVGVLRLSDVDMTYKELQEIRNASYARQQNTILLPHRSGQPHAGGHDATFDKLSPEAGRGLRHLEVGLYEGGFNSFACGYSLGMKCPCLEVFSLSNSCSHNKCGGDSFFEGIGAAAAEQVESRKLEGKEDDDIDTMCKNMKKLYLPGIVDTLNPIVQHFVALEHLFIEMWGMREPLVGLSEIGHKFGKTLKVLEVDDCGMDGEILNEIVKHTPELEKLAIDEAVIRDQSQVEGLIESMSILQNLRNFSVSSSEFHKNYPDFLVSTDTDTTVLFDSLHPDCEVWLTWSSYKRKQ